MSKKATNVKKNKKAKEAADKKSMTKKAKEAADKKSMTEKNIQNYRKELKAAEKLVNVLRFRLDLPMAAMPTIDSVNEATLFGDPNHCPFCGSGELTASDWDGPSRDTTCKVECDNCKSEWTEIYRLFGATDFVQGPSPDVEKTDGKEETSGTETQPVGTGSAASGPPCSGEGSPPVEEATGSAEAEGHARGNLPGSA